VTEITLKVLDKNDETPYFTNVPSPYLATVSENSGIGYTVYTLHAHDPDSNARLQYNLESGTNIKKLALKVFRKSEIFNLFLGMKNENVAIKCRQITAVKIAVLKPKVAKPCVVLKATYLWKLSYSVLIICFIQNISFFNKKKSSNLCHLTEWVVKN